MASSREQKKANVYRKLHQLRSVTNSTAANRTSIIVEACNYIEELKDKVERLNQDSGSSGVPSDQNTLPLVTVETLEEGFLINVSSEKNSPGLLVSVLEAFEELGLEVLDARVSCLESFQLQAIGKGYEGQGDTIDAEVVKQAVLQAAMNNQREQD